MAKNKTKLIDFSIKRSQKELAKHVESEERGWDANIECASCGCGVSGYGLTNRQAVADVAPCCKGWAVVFDRKVNDGEYPYCPKCVARLWPNK